MKTKARIAALALALALSGCEEKPTGATAADFERERATAVAKGSAEQAKQAKTGKSAPGAVGKKPQPADAHTNYGTQVAGYHYDGNGKRDPFRSFVMDRENSGEADAESPLQQFELGQLTVSGVVWQADRRRALVLDPAGQAYVVKSGDRIGKNDGVITDISDSSMLVLESYVDFHGDKTEKEIELRIRQSTGG